MTKVFAEQPSYTRSVIKSGNPVYHLFVGLSKKDKFVLSFLSLFVSCEARLTSFLSEFLLLIIKIDNHILEARNLIYFSERKIIFPHDVLASHIFNRPGVAGAALQTPLSLNP